MADKAPQGAAEDTKHDDRTRFRPRVIVKFHDDVDVPYEDGVERHLENLRLAPWSKTAEKVPRLTFRRMYTSVSPEEIQRPVNCGHHDASDGRRRSRG